MALQLESEINSDIKELTSEIRNLFTQIKKVEADVATVKNVTEKLVSYSSSVGPMSSTQDESV